MSHSLYEWVVPGVFLCRMYTVCNIYSVESAFAVLLILRLNKTKKTRDNNELFTNQMSYIKFFCATAMIHLRTKVGGLCFCG